MLLIALLSSSALAAGFGQAELVAGQPVDPSFQSCLRSDGCADTFLRFLTGSMMEQGFAMQGHALLSNPLVNPRDGWFGGAGLTTFPFAPPPENLSGKEENTQFSPVFPRISAGRLSSTGDRRSGLGFSLLPPIPVGGASALLLGVDGGWAFSDADSSGFGLHGDATYLRARAPITASEEQVADRDSFDNPNNIDPEHYAEVCGDEGCLDTFTMVTGAVRGGYGLALGHGLRPFAQLGVSVVYQRLFVEYDETSWALLAVQPSAHVGAGWAPGEHVQLALGGSAAVATPQQQQEETAGLFYRLEGAAGWAF